MTSCTPSLINFTGFFAASNWTTSSSPFGSITWNPNGPTDAFNTDVLLQDIDVAQICTNQTCGNSINISFDWSYNGSIQYGIPGPPTDESPLPFYSVGPSHVPIGPLTFPPPSTSGNITGSGTISNVVIPAGGQLCFYLSGDGGTLSNVLSGKLTINNFEACGTCICFLEGTKILCLENNKEIYLPIQTLKKGMLVKTLKNSYLPINLIGYSRIYNSDNKERITNKLFVCSKENYPELFEDLIITGGHSILVDSVTEIQTDDLIKIFGQMYYTDDKIRLLSVVDEKAEPYGQRGMFVIWHFSLADNDLFEDYDSLVNHGIYANGLLVESCSSSVMKDNMILVD